MWLHAYRLDRYEQELLTRGEESMKIVATAYAAALLLAFSGQALVYAQSSDLETSLGQANQMNNEEQDMANELRSKSRR